MKNNVIDSFDKVNLEYFANGNSLHKLGFNSRKLEEAAGNQILDVFGLKNYDVIYTSGNSESFTFILNNINNFSISTNSDELKKIANEMDININNSNSIKMFKHVDISGLYSFKSEYVLDEYDLITIEDEIPFFGVILKKKNIEFLPLIHGGKSISKYRGGTAPTSLIVLFSKLIKNKYNTD